MYLVVGQLEEVHAGGGRGDSFLLIATVLDTEGRVQVLQEEALVLCTDHWSLLYSVLFTGH